MDDFDQFERGLAAALRSDADMSVPTFEPGTIARAATASAKRRSVRIPRAFTVMRPSNRWSSVAAVIGVLVVGGAFLVIQRSQPAVVAGPSATPSADPSPSVRGVVAPSATPSATGPISAVVPGPAGVWIATGTMGTPRSGHTAVRLLDGRVLVVGGANGDEDNDTSAEVYDPNSATWTATGRLARAPSGFAFGAALLRDGKVLMGDEKGAEVYDPDVGTWTVTGKMALIDDDGSSHWGKATLLLDGRVLVVHDGGISELYDPDSGTWAATAPLTPPVDIPTPVTLPDGKVLVAGGHDTDRDGDRAALYDPATGTWTATGTMGTPRLEHLVVPLLDGRVLVVGGGFDDQEDTSAEVYDPDTGTWAATGSMLKTHTRFPATVLDDGRVLVGDADGAELYDPDTGTWTIAEKMVMPTAGSATLLADGTVLVAGSEGSAELYIPAGVAPPPALAATPPAGAWIPTGTMGTPRSGHTTVRLLDGRVLVAGGGPDENDTSAELYDPDTGTWSATGSMAKPPRCFPATLLRDGKVLVGVQEPGDDGETGAEVYDPATGTWTATGKMAIRRDCSLSPTLLRDGRVLVAGREGSQLYDPDSGTWAAAESMIARPGLMGRRFGAAVLLPDGRVLIAGGGTDNQYLDTAELFDPDTGSWTAIANMHSAKAGPRATLLRDGMVLVMGRSSNGQTAEVYDPDTGTWTTTGAFARPGARYGSVTLLSDGLVLAADDYGAELYDPDTGTWTTTGYPLRAHDGPLTLLLDGTVLVAGGRDCLDGICVATGSAELYVPAGVSPPPLPAFPSPAPPVFPDPTPSPTPVPPAVGPIPPDARTWTVTVMNRSSQPATLFVAEENEQGLLGRLVGSATPNVVAAGATVNVTFRVPAKGTGWAIFVNPGPDTGPLVGPAEMSLPVRILVMEDGQPAWSGGPFN
jgi:Kelch motif